jgi:hypothetical protein
MMQFKVKAGVFERVCLINKVDRSSRSISGICSVAAGGNAIERQTCRATGVLRSKTRKLLAARGVWEAAGDQGGGWV